MGWGVMVRVVLTGFLNKAFAIERPAIAQERRVFIIVKKSGNELWFCYGRVESMESVIYCSRLLRQ